MAAEGWRVVTAAAHADKTVFEVYCFGLRDGASDN